MDLVLLIVSNCKCLGPCFSIWWSGYSWKILTNQFLFNTMFFTNINIPFFELCSDLFSITKKISQIRNNAVCVVGSLVYVLCFAITVGCCSGFKGYPRYKTVTPQNILSEAQVKNFFYFVEKLCSVLKIFKFLCFQSSRDLANL